MMFIEGRGLTSSVALEGGLSRMYVNLRHAGFGVGVRDVAAPMLWFGHANAFARHDPQAGVLEVTDRRQNSYYNERQLPLLWLDLPQAYLERSLDEVDVQARGFVAADRITAGRLRVETWADVELRGLYIGGTCFAKTVRGNVLAQRVHAAPETSPQFAPTAELISVLGSASVQDSTASWRISARHIDAAGAAGPQHTTVLYPQAAPAPAPVFAMAA